ncbi:MAG: coproporphyrinogen III oxidase family protein [Candidatus Delongbacteria bacterium]|nr:coproporphyrinogen III oxidase family protein [Candidatus Delongbacteria bacterium]
MPPSDSFGVYIHVPWCSRRCGYCDFYAGVTRDPEVLRLGGERLRADLARQLASPAWSEGAIHSVYLGGGTPSLLPPEFFRQLLGPGPLAERLLPGAEITVELNPEHITDELAGSLVAAGITRASLGAQSADPGALAFLDREHDLDDLQRGLQRLRAAGLTNLSLDLIYQLPGQTATALRREIAALRALDPPHISAYGLGYEAGTRLDLRRRQGRVTPLDGDHSARLFRLLSKELRTAGYQHYEVSSFCRAGQESRHNRGYWELRDCLAVGPGASAWLNPQRATILTGQAEPWGLRLNRLPNLRLFNDAVDAGQPTPAEADRPDRDAALLEAVYLGLRWRQGLERRVLVGRFGALTADGIWARARLHRRRFQHCNGERLVLRPENWVLLDELVLSLLG